MNIQGFIELVRKMRTAQLDYYRDKHKIFSNLIAAKDLEKQVDAALRAGIDVTPARPTTAKQTSFMEATNEKQDQ